MPIHPLAEYLAPLTIPDTTDKRNELVINGAVENISTAKVHVVGVSGKKASGKDTVASGLIGTFGGHGLMTPIAFGIKNEASQMFKFLYEWINWERNVTNEAFHSGNVAVSRDTCQETKDWDYQWHKNQAAFARKFNLSRKHADAIVQKVYALLRSNPDVTGYSRNNEVISVLQYLGNEVRGSRDALYWTRKMLWHVAMNSAVEINCIIPDLRFAHEADAVKAIGGSLVRLDVSREEQIKRLQTRDGVDVSDAVLNHVSETALDDYQNFDVRVDSTTKNPDETLQAVLDAWRAMN